MNRKDKEINLLLIIPVMLALVLVIGITYALFTKTVVSNKSISIKTGSKYIGIYGENKNNVGLNTDYTFTIENRGTEDSGYELYLDDDNSNTIDLSTVTYSVIKNGNTTSNLMNIVATNRKIDVGNLKVGEKTTIVVKITTSNTGNYKGKLRIKYVDYSVPNTPAIVGDMIPVTYDGTNWVKADKTNTNNSWYNYDKQNWANVVTIKDPSKRAGYTAANVGTTIAIDDINTFLVWIPRYSYTLGNTYGYQIDGASTPSAATPGAFDIKFVNKNITDTGSASYTGSTAKNYYTPTSFCWGDTCDTSRTDSSNIELPGIWVSKFETTGTIDAISSIPNVTSLRSQTNSAFFNGIQSQMNGTNGTTNYGFSGSNYDTHMLKNNEWGAMAYLSQSKYGKYGNSDYTGANKEIYQNKSSGYITGSSNGTPSTSTTNTQVAYNVSGTGTGASTTGNISGIYDTSGGAWEPVMGNLNNTISYSSFSSMPSRRYYNLYTNSAANTACNGGVCLGDALSETASFYGDYAGMVSAQYPWVYRGGSYSSGALAGVFYFSGGSGSASSCYSARFVLGAW